MKRLLTTAMVLVMLVTMFCVSPVAIAAGSPEMVIKLVNSQDPANDTISATFTDVADASWVVWSLKDATTGEYLFINEMRGNVAEATGCTLSIVTAEKTTLQGIRNLEAEAKITYPDASVVTKTKQFVYYSFAEIQNMIRDVITGTTSIVDGTDALSMPRPAYYTASAELDAAIVASLAATYAAELANSSLVIEPDVFYTTLLNAMLLESINKNDAATIESILANYYGDVGLALTTTEKIWYDASATRASIINKLASLDYFSVVDFVNQFKVTTFLDRLAFEPLANIMNFLEVNNVNAYKNYSVDINASNAIGTNAGTVFALDFTPTGYYPASLSEDAKEYAASYMAGSYASLDALATRFSELLVELTSFTAPQTPTFTPSVGGFSGPSVSVGTSTPVVPEKTVPFTDIDDVEWAKEAIIALAEEGVINGVSSKQYQPNANVTREQFVKIIVNTFGLEASGNVAGFEDVNQNEWYASYINIAVDLGIIKGVSDTEFGIGQNITRQDMTLIMYRVANIVGVDVSAKSDRTFSDASSIDSYAIDAVSALYKAGIVNGVADGVFGGWQTATRAQAAKLCYDLRESK